MKTFTASNGVTVRIDAADYIECTTPGSEGYADNLDAEAVEDLREFFRDEEDERLGRWRWPEKPSYLVYPSGGSVIVVDQKTGHSNYSTRDRAYDENLTHVPLSDGARAYFEAHPEPWHTAKPGEVWALTWDGTEGVFLHAGGSWYGQRDMRVALDHPIRDNNVTAGRRIWPEES